MKTRKHNWYDAEQHKVYYGIMVLHEGSWEHAMKGNTPLLFETEEQRDRARADIRKKKADQ